MPTDGVAIPRMKNQRSRHKMKIPYLSVGSPSHPWESSWPSIAEVERQKGKKNLGQKNRCTAAACLPAQSEDKFSAPDVFAIPFILCRDAGTGPGMSRMRRTKKRN